MTKSETIALLSDELGLTQKDTKKCYDQLVELLGDELSKGKECTINGFGTFYTGVRKAYKSFNPHYRQMVMNPKKRVVYFRESEAMKKKINGQNYE